MFGDGMLPFPCEAGPSLCPVEQLSACAGSKGARQPYLSQLGWGFHTFRGSIDPRNVRFRIWVVVVVNVLYDTRSRDGAAPSPGDAIPQRCPKGKLSPRARSISPILVRNQPMRVEFPLLAGQ